jgi:hypothetical protein
MTTLYNTKKAVAKLQLFNIYMSAGGLLELDAYTKLPNLVAIIGDW